MIPATTTANTSVTVDIGTELSETQVGVAIFGWGTIEPTEHGGNWGGIATDPNSTDKLCRVIWAYGEEDECASITFTYDEPVIPTNLSYRHLDWGSDDSFGCLKRSPINFLC